MFPLESAPSCPAHLVTPECPKPIPDGPRIYRSGLEWPVDLERPVGSGALKPEPTSHGASRPQHTLSASQQAPDKRPLARARLLLIDNGTQTARGYPHNSSPRKAQSRLEKRARRPRNERADTRTSGLATGARGRAQTGRGGGRSLPASMLTTDSRIFSTLCTGLHRSALLS